MDRSDGIATLMDRASAGKPAGRSTALAHSATAALALAVLGVTVALLLVGQPSRGGWPDRRAPAIAVWPPPVQAAVVAGSGDLIHGDVIDGHPILDDSFIGRMKQVATRIPPAVLAGQARDPRVRYLAQAFTPGDDPGLTEGWFEDPAAALAFGCAVEDDASLACGNADGYVTPAGESALAADPSGLAGASMSSYGAVPVDGLAPGWRCEPMGVAVGAPAFEPNRCDRPG